MIHFQVPALVLPSVIQFFSQAGLPVEVLLEEAGIEPNLAGIENETIPFEKINALVEAMQRGPLPADIALRFGTHVHFDYLPELELYITSCDTVREALVVFDWVKTLICPFMEINMNEQGDETILSCGFPQPTPPTAQQFYIEALFAAAQRFGSLILGKGFRINRVRLGFPIDKPIKLYRDWFGCVVEAGATANQILLSTKMLDQTQSRHLEQIKQQAKTRMEQRVSAFQKKDDLISELRQAVLDEQHLLLENVEKVAVTMGMNARTLQRRLKERGASYSSVLDEVRFELAREKLLTTQASLGQIAQQLGFSDQRSFIRAFSRWSGMTPGRFRRQLASVRGIQNTR